MTLLIKTNIKFVISIFDNPYLDEIEKASLKEFFSDPWGGPGRKFFGKNFFSNFRKNNYVFLFKAIC